MILATAVALGWAFRARWTSPELLPLASEELILFELEAHAIGPVVEVAVFPVALIYLLSHTRSFQRVTGGRTSRGDTRRLFASMVAVLLLAHSYDLAFGHLAHQPPMLNVLVIVAGGLLGGWRVSLGLGVVLVLFRGSQDMVICSNVLEDIAASFRREGFPFLFHLQWGVLFLNHYLNSWATAGVWAGIAAGLGAELLGARRFVPLAAFLLGVSIDMGSACLTWIGGGPPGPFFFLPSALVTGLAMAVIALMVRSVQAKEAQSEAAAAQLARTQAELRALRAQINPHFLFNALNTIRYFVRTEPEAARHLLLDLSQVFQRALHAGDFVPLRDELAYVEAYLALEQARLGERLRVAWDLPGEEWLDHPVPTLTLQPIVENAVVHAVSRRTQGGEVSIGVRRAGDDLLLQVQDDGPGIPPQRLAEVLDRAHENHERNAIGLRNVDGRLRALYGEPYGLGIESSPGKGTRVRIRIPFNS